MATPRTIHGSTSAAKIRSQIGVAVRLKKPQDEIDELRRELRMQQIRDFIATLADERPPLTDEQRAELARILAPVVR